MIRKVFVTGATGVLGKRVVALLLEKGIGVVGLCRTKKGELAIEKIGALPVRGSLFNAGQLVLASAGCDAMIHLASSIPKKSMPKKPADWTMNDRIRVEGTRNLLKAAVINGIGKYIQPGVTLLYGDRKGAYVDRNTAVGSDIPFMLVSALEMERVIRLEQRVDHLILRFGSFYSEDSAGTQMMIDAIRRRRYPVIGNGNYYWNNIHADDAADAVVYGLLEFGRLQNKTLNFTDFNPLPFRIMVWEVARMTHSRKPLSIPAFLAKRILGHDLFWVLTASHRIGRDELIGDWQPRHPDFIRGMRDIINGSSEAP